MAHSEIYSFGIVSFMKFHWASPQKSLLCRERWSLWEKILKKLLQHLIHLVEAVKRFKVQKS